MAVTVISSNSMPQFVGSPKIVSQPSINNVGYGVYLVMQKQTSIVFIIPRHS